jgi:hypothetical protein
MGDTAKRARFEALRQHEEKGTLTQAEQAELAQMVEEIESAEAAYLRPATERLRAERSQIQARSAALQRLVRRKEELARRLARTLAEAKAERHAIEEEQSRILSGSAPPSA